jgi:hypothetical protein
VKQIFETLHANPQFVQRRSYRTSSEAKLTDNDFPLHGRQTIPYGWLWHELGLYLRNDQQAGLAVLCLNFPEQLQASVCTALKDGLRELEASDLWTVVSVILREILVLYTDSVWSLRNHVCKCETV